jgi:hypothetical protein
MVGFSASGALSDGREPQELALLRRNVLVAGPDPLEADPACPDNR